jgi:protein-S-isoprenylcysteine O-methyltransferase Ste14
MQKVVAAALAIGSALLVGGLVQVYYSGLPAESAWSGPALYSALGVILFSIGLWLFAWH